MIWVMVWLVCVAGTGCWLQEVEQEFPTKHECESVLAWYQEHEAVIGACRALDSL